MSYDSNTKLVLVKDHYHALIASNERNIGVVSGILLP